MKEEHGMIFAERLKELRERKNLTQTGLAEFLGYKNYTTVSKWESGDSLPRGREIKTLSEYFGVSADYLLGIDKELENKPLSSIERIPIPAETKTLPLYGDVAAGALAEIEGLKVWDVETIDIPTAMLGRYANDDHLFSMYVNGDSMNQVIPNGSIIVAKPLEDYMYKDGDIVIFNHDAEYSLKTYRPNMIDGFVVFEPNSDNAGFKNIAIDHTTLHDANMVSISGKVIFFSTIL
ncbi:putative phage related repressor [Brochothrix thermosphacta]|uniref:helix-turn-helix domain-containing protein n=1 Tax=Brochothrix thermosphacta TaxID=2756 RepID=UPI000D77636F|nr:XRE family transcriptional regulator [Brochothrix thermosphacta]SPN72458.1 putative phage related repressor [Brochothrix thermosphacta]